MTELEAREKWCPFMTPEQSNPYNDSAEYRSTRCIASGCAAWRWEIEPIAEPTTIESHSDQGHSIQDLPATAGSGFCGLAGKP